MNTLQFSAQPQNPFTHSEFWGRQDVIATIYKRLASQPPQCCAIIGETFIGKSSLARFLANPESAGISQAPGIPSTFTFVYLDCKLSIDTDREEQASVRFWWNLYRKTYSLLQPDQQPEHSGPKMTSTLSSSELTDSAFEIKTTLEKMVQNHPCPVIFVLDNFETVARLPLYNSEWLRAMVQHNCAYVVTARHLLYLLYQYSSEREVESWANPSPLYNLFSDPIYLGLIAEDEVEKFLLHAQTTAKKFGSIWNKGDLDFIRRYAGRHAELIRIACKNMFEQRLSVDNACENDEGTLDTEFLEFSIARDAGMVCNQLWLGLKDSELSGIPSNKRAAKGEEEDLQRISPYQLALIDVAKGSVTAAKNILFVLEQRGLIERVDGTWRVFADVMRQFVLKQEQIHPFVERAQEQRQPSNGTTPSVQTDSINEQLDGTIFTYLEGKVYDYLKAHLGQVCDREDIKQAVWGNTMPTNTALQKIIERIREKIEPDPDNPHYLIAIRGQGYLLREAPAQ
jgi:hypothetical protein